MERNTLIIAQIQMQVARDKGANIAHAERLIREAAQREAELLMLPEMFCCPYENSAFRPYGEAVGGEAQKALAALARELGVWIVGGSLPELEGARVYNTSFVYDSAGQQVARHRKMHLFDISVEGGQSFRESDTLTSGHDVTVFDTPWGKMGLCICFDLRFEELARVMALQGARVLLVPAAFNMTTGPAHWELLFRQRAVDNQLYTVGTSPARNEKETYVAWGHSIVCDPWGSVLHQCGAGEEVAVTALDLTRIESVRRQLPILSARREDVYSVGQK